MKDYIIYGVCPGCVIHDRAIKLVDDNMVTETKSCKDELKFTGGVLFWCDRNSDLWDEEKRIFPPEKIKDYSEAIVLICCYPVKQVVEMLRNLGCNNEIVVYPFFSFNFEIMKDKYNYIEWRNWFINYCKEISSIYEMSDETTERIISELIRQRSLPHPQFASLDKVIEIMGSQYFSDKELCPLCDMTLIDCGAYDGDSILMIESKYKNRLRKIYAIEPDSENIEKMKENLRERNLLERTSICACGVSDKESTLMFKTSGSMTSSFSEMGDCKVSINKIDGLVTELIGTPFIKMDIEGFEVEAIRGAKKIIKEEAPVMEICVYHKPEDILTVPETIREINPNYLFYLRGGFHTTCLAVPT